MMKKFTKLLCVSALSLLTVGNTLGSVVNVSAQDEVTLTWALWDKDATTYYQPLIDAYEAENPGIKIEMLDLGSTDYMTVLGTQLSGGDDTIDVALIKDTPGYVSLVNKSQLEPLSELASDVDVDQYGGVIDQITMNEDFYALPVRNDFYVLYYNKDIFDAAGVDYPQNGITWDEYTALVQEVSEKGSEALDKHIYGGHYHTWRSQVQLYGVLDGENTLVSDDYSFLQPFYEDVLAEQEAEQVQDYSVLKTASLHYSAAFYQNNVATLLMGTWFMPTLKTAIENGESEEFKWGIATMPIPEGVEEGTTAGTITSVGINANSKQKEEAYKFLQFLSSPEGSEIIAKTGTMPAIQNEAVVDTIAEATDLDETSKDALSIKQMYLELPITEIAAEVETILNDGHDNIMTGNAEIADELANISEQVKALLQ